MRRNQPPWTQKVNWTYARRSEDVETAYWNVLYKFNVCFVAREFIVGRGLLTPPFYEKPLSCLLFFFKFCPIPRWLHWLLQIWSVTLLNNIMDIHMLSLGILIPEGPSYVFYATRDQIYWGLRHIFFCLTSRIKCSNFSLLKILFNTFQIKRLDLCQKLLVSLKMTGYLNDNALSLQCIVQIYGLLCPIIYWQLPVSPVLQVKYFSN